MPREEGCHFRVAEFHTHNEYLARLPGEDGGCAVLYLLLRL